MADLEVRWSERWAFARCYFACVRALGHEIELVPIRMAAGQKARYSSLDSFGEVPSVEEDGDFKLADYEPVNVTGGSILRSTAHPDLVASSWILQPALAQKQLWNPYRWVDFPSKDMGQKQLWNPYRWVDFPRKDMGVESFELVDSLQPHVKAKCFCIGLSKYKGVESFDLVDSLQRRHEKAKCCCCFGLSKYMGVDAFEHSCVDVHACYKGTLPWLAPRGPRISKLSRADTAAAAAAPAPSRPFSFRASLTVSLSVFFE